MEKEKCVMCGKDAVYTSETRELLCEKCAVINQEIAKEKEVRR